MIFTAKIITSADENPIETIVDVCRIVLERLEETNQQNDWMHEEYELLMEASAFIDTIIETNDLFTDYKIPELSGGMSDNCSTLSQYVTAINNDFQARATELKMEAYKNRYKTALHSSFSYEFSQGDLDRVQTLINELRDSVSTLTALDSEHKARLLKRLEKLQSELHKRVSDLDRFWGMVGDAGVVFGKLGNDAKPIVDRIKEISEIVWRTQARTEELPSDSLSPLLEHDKENT